MPQPPRYKKPREKRTPAPEAPPRRKDPGLHPTGSGLPTPRGPRQPGLPPKQGPTPRKPREAWGQQGRGGEIVGGYRIERGPGLHQGRATPIAARNAARSAQRLKKKRK